MLQLSVVIPTYNRCEILRKCLIALFHQHALDAVEWEIIVIDDGSTDSTADVVQGLKPLSPVSLTYFHQANSGPGAARNRGIRSAIAPLVLMIGDDILASPSLLYQHLLAHHQYPSLHNAILGPVAWPPTLTVTPFMHWWLENRFRFRAVQTGAVKLDFTFFYTCNISVKRDFLLQHGLFDETFSSAAYEDTELAHRLHQQGLELQFVPMAKAYHDHPTDLESASKQIETIGYWSVPFEAKTKLWSAPPNWIYLGRFTRLCPLVFKWFDRMAERQQRYSTANALYSAVMIYHFWIGRYQYLQLYDKAR